MDGTLIPAEQLGEILKEARTNAGLTQAQAGEQFNVTRGAIAQAEGPSAGYSDLRVRIIETLTSNRVEGPYFRIVPKTPSEGVTETEAAVQAVRAGLDATGRAVDRLETLLATPEASSTTDH